MSDRSDVADSVRKRISIAVVMACHNRRAKTELCLKSLKAFAPSNWDIRLHVADDGSNDGTSDLVRAIDPDALIVRGSGSWFWARSMAEAEHLVDSASDYILWLNDDVTFCAAGLTSFESIRVACPEVILVGQCADPDTGAVTYGGYIQPGHHPLRLTRVVAHDEPVSVQIANGNVVLVPRAVRDLIGGIDGHFAHGYADFDFTLRARLAGITTYVVPGIVGFCKRNEPIDISSLRMLFSPKGLPLASHFRYMRRHGGNLWIIYLAAPYLKHAFHLAVSRMKRIAKMWHLGA